MGAFHCFKNHYTVVPVFQFDLLGILRNRQDMKMVEAQNVLTHLDTNKELGNDNNVSIQESKART